MPTKTTNLEGYKLKNSRITLMRSDSNDSGPGDNPRCLVAVVEVAQFESKTLFVENVTRDANGAVNGRVAVLPFTEQERTNLKSIFRKMYEQAMLDSGYVVNPEDVSGV